MYRPNGIAVVTTGLGAVVLFNVIWSWGRHPEPRVQPSMPPSRAAFDAGTAFQLHSGAWRVQPARADTAPEPVTAALPATETWTTSSVAPFAPMAASTRAEAPPPAVRSVPIQPIGRPIEPSTPPPEADASAEAVPAAPPTESATAAAPSASIPQGRMALAGPDAEAEPPAPANHVSRSAPPARAMPKAQIPAPAAEADAPAPIPIDNKFGPGNFKALERNGF
jgi:hypothetical protein